jgi:hypothetical protein
MQIFYSYWKITFIEIWRQLNSESYLMLLEIFCDTRMTKHPAFSKNLGGKVNFQNHDNMKVLSNQANGRIFKFS